MIGLSHLQDLTRDEVRALAPDATLILPTAAMEQHGPHLPLATDTILVEGVARRAAERAGRETSVCLAPTLAFGNSHHHLVYAALSLRPATFGAVVGDLLDSVVRAGFRRIFLLNGHGGNDELIRLAARDLVLQADVTVAAASYWTIARAAVARTWGGEPYPGHAGTFETALMLALAPERVRDEARPVDADHPRPLSYRGLLDGALVRHGEWARIDGYSDAPIGASRELGEALLEVIAGEVAEAILALDRAGADAPPAPSRS